MSITPESLNTKADDAERWASDKSYRGTEMEVTRLLSYALHFRTAADTIAALTAQVEEAKGTIEVLLGEARPAEEVLSSAQRYSDSLAEVARLTAENERLKEEVKLWKGNAEREVMFHSLERAKVLRLYDERDAALSRLARTREVLGAHSDCLCQAARALLLELEEHGSS